MKHVNLKKIAAAILVVLVIAFAARVVIWNQRTMGPSETALIALQSDDQIKITQESGWIVFEAASGSTATGFIFYPGAGVDYRSYAPLLRQIAQQGYFVALVHMPLNLAFFDINAANQVMEQYPNIQHWAVGGHSLGGVAASNFAAKNLDSISGLIFWASYPADDALAAAKIKVLSIYGTNDMGGMDPFDKSRSQLPADTKFVVINGGNHAQFGSYGAQPGDKAATISAEEQWMQINDVTIEFLKTLEN